MGAVRVVVAGFGPIYRAGLCTILPTADGDVRVAVVGEAGELARCVGLIRLLRPIVVITDLSFSEGPRRSAQELLAAHPDTSLLLLAERAQVQAHLETVEELVSGAIVGPSTRSELLAAIDTVSSGRPYSDHKLTDLVLPHANPSGRTLTEREAEILQLLAFGYTNAEIASHLVISIRTAESHRSNIQRKLGVRTRAELARAAWREGLASRTVAEHGAPA